MNDGYSIHLYYSEMYKGYVAYGFSAFIAIEYSATEKKMPELSYSKPLQMPMVVVRQELLDLLFNKGLYQGESKDKNYCHIRSFIQFDEHRYDEWVDTVRK